MSLESYITKFWKPSNMACLSIDIKENGFLFNFLSVNYKKGELVPVLKEEGISKSDLHLDFIPPNIPLCILLEGRGVVHKKVSLSEKKEVSIFEVFPNIKLAEFYAQEVLTEEYVFYSVIRKETLDEILKTVKDFDLNVVKVILGHYEFSLLLDYMNTPDVEVNIGGKKLVYRSGELMEYCASTDHQNEEISISLGGKTTLNQLFICLYASVLSIYKNKNDIISPNVESVQHNFKESVFQFFFKKAVVFYGVGLFIALFVNGIFFTYLYSESSKQDQVIELNTQENLLQKNETDIQNRYRYFYQENSWSPYPIKTYYLQKIIKNIPSDVLLTDFSFSPLLESESQKKMYPIFDTKKIMVSGTCNNTLLLNDWIENIKTNEWVSESKVIQYNFDEYQKRGLFKFIVVVE